MSKVKFYYIPESPPCRAVELTASLLGVELEKHYVNLFEGEHFKDEFRKLNPQSKVPCVADGDLVLAESRAIMRYLANKNTSRASELYPSDPKKRAKVDELLDYDLGSLYAAAYRLFRPLYTERDSKMSEKSEMEYREVLQKLEARLKAVGGQKFLTGDHLTIGDVSVTVSMSYSEAFEFALDEYPSLVAYVKRAKESMPKYGEICDEAIENFTKFIQSFNPKVRLTAAESS